MRSSPCLELLLVVFLSSTTFGNDAAPPAPGQPWSPPDLRQYEDELTSKNIYAKQDAATVQIDPEKIYDLVSAMG